MCILNISLHCSPYSSHTSPYAFLTLGAEELRGLGAETGGLREVEGSAVCFWSELMTYSLRFSLRKSSYEVTFCDTGGSGCSEIVKESIEGRKESSNPVTVGGAP